VTLGKGWVRADLYVNAALIAAGIWGIAGAIRYMLSY